MTYPDIPDIMYITIEKQTTYFMEIKMKTFLEIKHGKSLVNFIKKGNTYTPDVTKFIFIRAITGRGVFTKLDLSNFSNIGLAVQVDGHDYLAPHI